jgi:hypothetical protein
LAGKYFYEKISYYVPEMVKTRLETLEAERTLPRETLVQWKVECVAWEADATQPNPFKRKTKEISIASVRYELAEKGGGIVRGRRTAPRCWQWASNWKSSNKGLVQWSVTRSLTQLF